MTQSREQSESTSPAYQLPVAIFGLNQIGMAESHYNALLEALKTIRAHAPDSDCAVWRAVFAQVDAAIAKAVRS